jgi:hypothetical protein
MSVQTVRKQNFTLVVFFFSFRSLFFVRKLVGHVAIIIIRYTIGMHRFRALWAVDVDTRLGDLDAQVLLKAIEARAVRT